MNVVEGTYQEGVIFDPSVGPLALALVTEEFDKLPQPKLVHKDEIKEELYISAIRTVIEKLAGNGQMVIVGRGASEVLAGSPSTLRVGIVSSWEDRIERTMVLEKIDADEAIQRLKGRDQARMYFYNRYFGIDDPDDANRFHLMINTSEIGINHSVNLICETVGNMDRFC